MIYAIIAIWLICGAFAGLNIALQIFENDPIEVKAMMLIAAAIVAALGPLGLLIVWMAQSDREKK